MWYTICIIIYLFIFCLYYSCYTSNVNYINIFYCLPISPSLCIIPKWIINCLMSPSISKLCYAVKTQGNTFSVLPLWPVIEHICSHKSQVCDERNVPWQTDCVHLVLACLLSVKCNINMQICRLNFTILSWGNSSPLKCSFTCGEAPCITLCHFESKY